MGIIDKKHSTPKYQMIKNLGKEYQKEIAKHAQRLVDAANKRLRRIEQAKITSPAYSSAMATGGYFSGKGFSSDYNRLMHEYARVIKFLNMQTSTLGGAKKYDREMEARIGFKPTPKQRELIFNVFRKIEELHPAEVEIFGSDKLIQYISDMFHGDINNAIFDLEKGTEEYENALMENFRLAEERLSELYDELDEFVPDTSAFRKINL